VLLGAAVVFWRAMFAKASRMEEPFVGAGAAGAGAAAWFCNEARRLTGGLPGGVVELSIRLTKVRKCLPKSS
jgi:phage tail tape-measure protein